MSISLASLGSTLHPASYALRNMAYFSNWIKSLVKRPPSPPISFPTSGFETIEASVVIEEEQRKGFADGDYYPICIGDVLDARYQVVGKLGFGVSSTVWLARDLL